MDYNSIWDSVGGIEKRNFFSSIAIDIALCMNSGLSLSPGFYGTNSVKLPELPNLMFQFGLQSLEPGKSSFWQLRD